MVLDVLCGNVLSCLLDMKIEKGKHRCLMLD